VSFCRGRALEVGTTVKLARALWIIPLTLVLSRVWKREQAPGDAKPKRPWFILGFVAMAALVTWVPVLQPIGKPIATVARQVLVLTLFLVGAGVSREALRSWRAGGRGPGRPWGCGPSFWA